MSLQAVAGRDEQITRLNRMVAERHEQIARLNRTVAELDERIARLNRARIERFQSAPDAGDTPARRDSAGSGLLSRRYCAASRTELAERTVDAAKNGGKIPILFDPAFYLDSNEDVRSSGVDPLEHYLGWGAVEGRMPIGDVDPDALHPLVRDLHRLDPARDGAFALDSAFYRSLYPDLASFDDEALAEHYEFHGRAESRMHSTYAFVSRLCDNPKEIPLDFDPDEYIDLYSYDLGIYYRDQPLQALRHYMRHGRWEPRYYSLRALRVGPSPTSDSSGAAVTIPSESIDGTPPLCILAHVYYPELWEELSDYIGNLPRNTYDLYVNLVDTTFSHDLISRIRDRFPSARIYVSENRGRDIGGHVRLLENIQRDDYRIYGLVHTKMSPQLPRAESILWRRRLLGALMGTREYAAENIALMLEDDTVGQIAAADCRWTKVADERKYRALLDRLDVGDEARDVECVTGAMMFLRADVLRRVFEGVRDLPFEDGSDKSPSFHADGQWEHAVEHIIGSVVRDMHYRFEWR